MGGSQGWKNRRRQLCLQSLQPPMLWLSCHSDTSWLRRKPQARSRIHPHTDPLPSPWLDTVSKTNPHFRNFRDLTPPSACCAKKRSAQSRGEVGGTLSYPGGGFQAPATSEGQLRPGYAMGLGLHRALAWGKQFQEPQQL